MTLNSFLQRSVKTRVTLFTLIIFVISIWTLTFYISRLLKDDMQRVLGDQQFATVSFIAAQVNDELSNRLAALELVAKLIDAHLMGNPATLQARLEQRPILQSLFNGGIFVTGPDGTAIASLPQSVGRVGINYMDRDSVAISLKEGKTVISRPVIGKKLGAPLFTIAAPIRDAHGKVTGTLVGVVDLGRPSFLDKITDLGYGQTGGYLLIAPQHQLIVTATDKSRIMQPLPAAGINAMHDRYMHGYEGFGVAVSSRGVLELSAAKSIPAAGWFVAAILPAEEAFAPIDAMLKRMLLSALLVTLLAGALTWWLISQMLQRQLAPMLTASRALATLATSDQPVPALPVTRQDEIGELIGGFNRLLETLRTREQALLLKQNMLARTEGIAHVGSWEWDVATDTVKWSDEMFRIFQRNPTEGTPTFAEHPALYFPEDMQRLQDAVGAALSQGTPYELELHAIRRDGATRVCLARGHVEMDADKRVTRLFGSLLDITERKQAEKDIFDLAERYRLANKATNDVIWDWDVIQDTQRWNEAGTAVFGWTEIVQGPVNAHWWVERVHPDDAERVHESFFHVVNNPELDVWQDEYRFRKADGTYAEVMDRGCVLRDECGKAFRMIGAMQDITEHKQAELEIRNLNASLEERVRQRTADLEASNLQLTQAKIQAETANIAKSAFLANMSHEIRTPMNGIIGMAHILRREGVTPQQAKRLDTIDASALHLLSVINDVLDLSKIEAGKFELEEAPVVVSSLLTNVSSILSERVKDKGLHLLVESGDLPPNLVGDPTRLQQALLNYATNAVKFTEQGTVTLRTLMQEETAESVMLRFEVQDTGIGIAPEAMTRLFSAFEQADNTMNRKYGGTGLGLAITQRLADLMGGKVGADSTAGVGSTFWFTVKLKKGEAAVVASMATAADAETELRQRYAGQRILLVDDEPINREVARMQIEDVDLLVDAAVDGEEAVAMARKTRYTAIFMDMQMPKLNGVEATQQIRQLPGYQDTPIIAMTANAFAEDKAQCLAAGMNDFLIKPFIPEELFAILLRALSRRDV